MHNQDLNTALANLERTFSSRADRCAARADELRTEGEIRAKQSATGAYGRQELAEAEARRAEAAVWRERAKVAGEGYLLVDSADFGFQREYSQVMAQAAREHRIRFDGRRPALREDT